MSMYKSCEDSKKSCEDTKLSKTNEFSFMNAIVEVCLMNGGRNRPKAPVLCVALWVALRVTSVGNKSVKIVSFIKVW